MGFTGCLGLSKYVWDVQKKWYFTYFHDGENVVGFSASWLIAKVHGHRRDLFFPPDAKNKLDL